MPKKSNRAHTKKSGPLTRLFPRSAGQADSDDVSSTANIRAIISERLLLVEEDYFFPDKRGVLSFRGSEIDSTLSEHLPIGEEWSFDGDEVVEYLCVDNMSDLSYQVIIESGPKHGVLKLQPETGEFSYAPDEQYKGIDSFVIEVKEPEGTLMTCKVVIDIRPEQKEEDRDPTEEEDQILEHAGFGPDIEFSLVSSWDDFFSSLVASAKVLGLPPPDAGFFRGYWRMLGRPIKPEGEFMLNDCISSPNGVSTWITAYLQYSLQSDTTNVQRLCKSKAVKSSKGSKEGWSIFDGSPD